MDKTMGSIDRLSFGSVPHVPSIALGAGEVTLQSMSSAYAAFANGGQVVRPILIRRVEDREGNGPASTRQPQLTQRLQRDRRRS